MRIIIRNNDSHYLPSWENPDSPWCILHNDILRQSLEQYDFPLLNDFEIVLEKRPGSLDGYDLIFTSRAHGVIAYTSWSDRDLRKQGFAVPRSADDIDQGWHFSLWNRGDYVYVWESNFDRPRDGIQRWFKVPWEQYASEWQQAIKASIKLAEEETEDEKRLRLAPPGSSLYGIVMLSPDEGWAVGGTFAHDGQPQTGCILHYRQGRWEAQEVNVPLLALAFSSPKNGWAVGVHGAIFHFDGEHWQQQPSFTDSTLRSISLHTQQWSIIVGESNLSWHYNGQTWSSQTIVERHYSFRGVRTADGTIVFPDRTDPQQTKNIVFHCTVMRATNDAWCVGDEGKIFRFNGKRWAPMWDFFYHFNSLSLVSFQEWWAVGEKGIILHYKGMIESSYHPVNETLYAVSMLSKSDGWTFGSNGIILHYNGHSWEPQPRITTRDLRACHMLSPNEGWCVGQDYTILHYKNGIWQHTTVHL